ncbi:MAG TPA: hypothetical protein VKA86_17780, partial [Candidatus Krumholzibacteria bacterium]|nr:hypothetical protein [Candidatus Krumholzibacteria bacterium]
ALVGLLTSTIRVVVDLAGGHSPTATALVTVGICLWLTLLWVGRIRPSWVRMTADAYATQLVRACELLGPREGEQQA